MQQRTHAESIASFTVGFLETQMKTWIELISELLMKTNCLDSGQDC